MRRDALRHALALLLGSCLAGGASPQWLIEGGATAGGGAVSDRYFVLKTYISFFTGTRFCSLEAPLSRGGPTVTCALKTPPHLHQFALVHADGSAGPARTGVPLLLVSRSYGACGATAASSNVGSDQYINPAEPSRSRRRLTHVGVGGQDGLPPRLTEGLRRRLAFTAKAQHTMQRVSAVQRQQAVQQQQQAVPQQHTGGRLGHEQKLEGQGERVGEGAAVTFDVQAGHSGIGRRGSGRSAVVRPVSSQHASITTNGSALLITDGEILQQLRGDDYRPVACTAATGVPPDAIQLWKVPGVCNETIDFDNDWLYISVDGQFCTLADTPVNASDPSAAQLKGVLSCHLAGALVASQFQFSTVAFPSAGLVSLGARGACGTVLAPEPHDLVCGHTEKGEARQERFSLILQTPASLLESGVRAALYIFVAGLVGQPVRQCCPGSGLAHLVTCTVLDADDVAKGVPDQCWYRLVKTGGSDGTSIATNDVVQVESYAYSEYCSVAIDGSVLCVSAQPSNATRNVFRMVLDPRVPLHSDSVFTK